MIENVLTFTTAVLILFTSLGIAQMCNWSVIHGIKRKPHLSVVWNWYHFVAIAILHQPRPTDSADINTRLQLSDTSSIPPMHGGFLLVADHEFRLGPSQFNVPRKQIAIWQFIPWRCIVRFAIYINHQNLFCEEMFKCKYSYGWITHFSYQWGGN